MKNRGLIALGAAGLGALGIYFLSRSVKRDSRFYKQALEATETALGIRLKQKQRNSLRSICYWNEKLNARDNGSQLVYIIATAWHESKLMPVREGFKDTDREARNFVTRMGYFYAEEILGHVWYGRGLIQITLLDNYRKIKRLLGYDIVSNPDLALDTDVAAHIMVYGMINGIYRSRPNGQPYKLSDYISNEGPNDYFYARNIVNSRLDNAGQINRTAVAIANNERR